MRKFLSNEKMKKNARQVNGTKELLSDSSSSTNVSTTKQQRQKEAMQKLGKIFKKKTEQKKPDSWQSLIQNLLHSQRGKLPLLLAVEAGNQSMVRELLSSQTQEQLKVSPKFYYLFYSITNFHLWSSHLLTDSRKCL